MSLSRRNPRRDENEWEIVVALKRVGAEVTQVSGRGAPDLLVRHRGVLHGWEIKTRTGTRTKAQQATQWPVVRSVADALAALGL